MRAVTVAFKATVVACVLVSVAFTPGAQARVSCSYSGAPTNLLSVRSGSEDLEIYRHRSEIMVGEFLAHPLVCGGALPTVLNVDTVDVAARGILSVDFFLAGGPFAPGATPEAVGGPEIELGVSGRGVIVEVNGTSGRDELQWTPGGAHAGLNLNPGSAGDQDADVTVRGRDSFIVAAGGGGNDEIVPAPTGVGRNDGGFAEGGLGNDVLIAPSTGAILEGGPGRDRLIGSRLGDDLAGGPGPDHLEGAGGRDVMVGGKGRDVLMGGRGRDRINSRDKSRDLVACGPGRDRVKADRRDRLRGCEVVRRR